MLAMACGFFGVFRIDRVLGRETCHSQISPAGREGDLTDADTVDPNGCNADSGHNWVGNSGMASASSHEAFECQRLYKSLFAGL